jgi:hypothetical protein
MFATNYLSNPKKGLFMKRSMFVLFSLVLFTTVHAGVMDGPANPYLHKGDIIVGGKLALVGVYGAGAGFILNGEYGFKEGFLSIPNFPTSLGLGGSIGYSGYSEDYGAWGKYSYTNFLILVTGYYHVQLIKNAPIDTYAMLNVGVNIATASYDGSLNGAPDVSNSDGGFTIGSGIGARYYFTNRLAAVGEVGFGMGVIRIGLDFKI